MTTDKLYTPRAGTLAHQVCLYLYANPRDLLTARGIALMFDGIKDVVPNQLSPALIAGLLRHQREDAEVYFRAGPNINRMAEPGDTPPQPQPPQPTETPMAITKQIPAKATKIPKDEDYSTPYKPHTVLVASPVPPVPPAPHKPKPPRKDAQFIDLTGLEICDDPLPGLRAPIELKYGAIFNSMAPGKCIKCDSKDVGKLACGMRKYFERKGITDKVKTISSYEADGRGRVWWVANKEAA